MKISVDTLAKFLGKSERTAWRLLTNNVIKTEIIAGKSKIEFNDVKPYLNENIKGLNPKLIEACDQGDATAETELAIDLLEAGNYQDALVWLNRAASKDYPDALQILGDLYIKGIGTATDYTKGIMLISKAATLGHQIAIAQIDGITKRQ